MHSNRACQEYSNWFRKKSWGNRLTLACLDLWQYLHGLLCSHFGLKERFSSCLFPQPAFLCPPSSSATRTQNRLIAGREAVSSFPHRENNQRWEHWFHIDGIKLYLDCVTKTKSQASYLWLIGGNGNLFAACCILWIRLLLNRSGQACASSANNLLKCSKPKSLAQEFPSTQILCRSFASSGEGFTSKNE